MVLSTKRFVLSIDLCYFVLVFFSPFSIVITSLGEERVILVLFVHLFDLRLFGFVCFLFLLESRKGCGLWLWHSLDFSLTFLAPSCFLTITLLSVALPRIGLRLDSTHCLQMKAYHWFMLSSILLTSVSAKARRWPKTYFHLHSFRTCSTSIASMLKGLVWSLPAQSKLLRPCRAGQFTWPHFSWTGLVL